MNDIQIRQTLKQHILTINNNPFLIDELGCCQGAVRIDLALIDTSLHGFEIKSEMDNLSRLSFQSLGYNYIFETLTLVTCNNHINHAIDIIPDWWGIWLAEIFDNEISITEKRKPKTNLSRGAYEIASLLWKEEAFNIIDRLAPGAVNHKTIRYDLWSYLANILSVEQLTEIVCETIKNRRGWRVSPKQVSNDGSSRPVAKSRRYRSKLYRSRNPQYIGLPN